MRGPAILLCAPVLAAAAAALGPIAFEEIADRAGLHFIADSCPTANKNLPETMLAGVALLDYDNDGYMDVYFVNGAAIPSLTKDSPKYWNRLFHNNRNGTFTDVTEKAGVKGEGYGIGVAVGDYDNDGWPDIFLANVTKNQLLHNNHDGTFTDVTDEAGVGGGSLDGRKMWAVSAGWFDYDNDGRLDLFVSNYCKWEVNEDPFCGPNPNLRAYCHPKNYAPLPNTLYHNNGDGTFTDVSAATGIAAVRGKGMGVAFADYDHDGFMDVFVANDNAPNMLFHNVGGKKFEEVALPAGVAYPESGAYVSGMGADFRDMDNDGYDDVWLTAFDGDTFPLFKNRGAAGDFAEITAASGVATVTRPMSAWSNGIYDFDNDGWKDLLAVRGHVLDNIALMSLRKPEEPNTVLRNLGSGKFQDVSTGAGEAFQSPQPHRGAAFGDLDNDGRVDAVVTVLNGKAQYFHNISRNGNHWILLKLVGVKSNRMGLGAQVRVTTEEGTQYNHATTSTGYAASSDPRLHFGLGRAKMVKQIDITWPSRIHQTLSDVPADQILTVTEQADTR
ncbi:MAG TPA: CRTAC1 family protein [Bryobacteraceae bacterium]|nr:CRTAC1 family protein [Bryobacteraceae bacterium]